MEELHKNEQYFFDQPTLDALTKFVIRFSAPCCLCAPSLGASLAATGANVVVLDIDKRFSNIRGFKHWDIYRPEWLGIEFDLIVCDPPFFNVSLSQLFDAIRLLARHNFQQKLLISYLSRRSSAIEGTFAPFGLKATGLHPHYRTVKKLEKNEIQFFGNLPNDELDQLKLAGPAQRE